MSEANIPVEVIVAAFQNEDGAKAALKELKQAKRQGLIKIDDAAVIRKDEKGKLHIKETADMSTGKGAGIGAVIGGVVGLLGGPVGVGPRCRRRRSPGWHRRPWRRRYQR